MERRRDWLLRSVVDHVQPAARAYGFTPRERGSHPQVRWVEFTRPPRGRWPAAAREARLLVYHLSDYHEVGAGLHWRDPSGRPTRRSYVWRYEPGTAQTPDGRPLPTAIRGWVEEAIAGAPDD